MSLRSLEYAIVESVVGISRNALMSIVSITTVALTLAVLGGVALFILGVNNAADSILSKFQIAVWLQKETSEEDIAELGSEIQSLPHMASVKLVSADEAWEEIKEDLGGQIELSGVEPSTLSAHFRVKLDDPRYTVGTANAIRRMPHIEEVIEGKQIVQQVVRFGDFVKLVGGIVAGVLFLVTAFIVSNTIRLTVYARRREIKIMQLVGATNWFVRLPFVLEGMILGAFGGGIACLLVFGGSHYVNRLALQLMPLLRQFSSGIDQIHFFASLVGLGCLVGATASMISVRRYLKA